MGQTGSTERLAHTWPSNARNSNRPTKSKSSARFTRVPFPCTKPETDSGDTNNSSVFTHGTDFWETAPQFCHTKARTTISSLIRPRDVGFFCAAGITFKAHPQFITLKAGETPSALHQAPELPGWPLPSTPTPGFRNQGSKPLQQSTLTRPGKRSWLQWEAIHWDLWVQMQHQHKNLVLFLQLVPVHFCWMTSQSSSSVSIIGVSPHLSYRTQQVAPFFLWVLPSSFYTPKLRGWKMKK